MTSIKEKVLREFGDHGADTFKRYLAQIEYTAFWCIRMLRDAEGIEAVIPEAVEDVIIIQRGIHRLHQVKTRDESQGSWTTAEVLPILCQQYHRRKAFPGEKCHFHLVSNQVADTKTALGPRSYGALYRIKDLLDILHNGQDLSSDELGELNKFEEKLVPKIQQKLLDEYNDDIDHTTATALLRNTWIQTNSLIVTSPKNLDELEAVLSELFPGAPPHTLNQLNEIYDHLILLVMRKIIQGTSLETRHINREDVLNCRTEPIPVSNNLPDLNQIPGNSLLEKKTYLGGFDPTEIPIFVRQKILATRVERRLRTLRLENVLDHFITSILDLHRECRHNICREQGIDKRPGPMILSKLRVEFPNHIRKYCQIKEEIDEQFCLGILWQQTDLCLVFWHELDNS